jgi:hypothetical protein
MGPDATGVETVRRHLGARNALTVNLVQVTSPTSNLNGQRRWSLAIMTRMATDIIRDMDWHEMAGALKPQQG